MKAKVVSKFLIGNTRYSAGDTIEATEREIKDLENAGLVVAQKEREKPSRRDTAAKNGGSDD